MINTLDIFATIVSFLTGRKKIADQSNYSHEPVRDCSDGGGNVTSETIRCGVEWVKGSYQNRTDKKKIHLKIEYESPNRCDFTKLSEQMTQATHSLTHNVVGLTLAKVQHTLLNLWNVGAPVCNQAAKSTKSEVNYLKKTFSLTMKYSQQNNDNYFLL